jgi:hypothetical protein
MDYIHNFHRVRVFKHPINHYEGQRRQGQFARAIHAPTPSAVREVRDHSEPLINRLANLPRCGGILKPNVIHYAFEVGRRIG